MTDLFNTQKRDWIVLLIGGASGTGKSSIAYELGRFYGVNILEVDDIVQALKAVSTAQTLPAVHYWETGVNWMDVGVAKNVDWLISVSQEILPALQSVVQRHLDDKVPVILEGDFIHPQLAASFESASVRSIFIDEKDKEQIRSNYLLREGGEPQHYRAEISVAYGQWLERACKALGVPVLEPRPWDSLLKRAMAAL